MAPQTCRWLAHVHVHASRMPRDHLYRSLGGRTPPVPPRGRHMVCPCAGGTDAPAPRAPSLDSPSSFSPNSDVLGPHMWPMDALLVRSPPPRPDAPRGSSAPPASGPPLCMAWCCPTSLPHPLSCPAGMVFNHLRLGHGHVFLPPKASLIPLIFPPSHPSTPITSLCLHACRITVHRTRDYLP